MRSVDAALVAALVLAAGPLLDALLLADSVVGPARHVRAGQLLVHGSASAKHLNGRDKYSASLSLKLISRKSCCAPQLVDLMTDQPPKLTSEAT